MTTTYTTTGDVRGGCGHRHRSVETAHACLMIDARDCANAGGYSDRAVVAVEPAGQRPLNDCEIAEWERCEMAAAYR